MDKNCFEGMQPFGAPMAKQNAEAKRPLDRLVITPRCVICGKFMKKLDSGEWRCKDVWQAEPGVWEHE